MKNYRTSYDIESSHPEDWQTHPGPRTLIAVHLSRLSQTGREEVVHSALWSLQTALWLKCEKAQLERRRVAACP